MTEPTVSLTQAEGQMMAEFIESVTHYRAGPIEDILAKLPLKAYPRLLDITLDGEKFRVKAATPPARPEPIGFVVGAVVRTGFVSWRNSATDVLSQRGGSVKITYLP